MTLSFVEIETEAGTCTASLSQPDGSGPWPAVIMYPDAGGARDTIRGMGDKLAASGYLVLVPDVYYRVAAADRVDVSDAFTDSTVMGRVIAMAQSYTADMLVEDTEAFVTYLDGHPEKKPGGVGTTGYCMGGRLSLLAAAHLGERISAAASFHGGNLATDDDPTSPHHRADAVRAQLYVGAAIEDPYFTDADRERLADALSTAGVTHTIETYQAHHGFAVPDNPTFDREASDRHWSAMQKLFGSVLGS
ncbi:MAG TPA: dienelactone hydrolase family protein [Acidimicrobiales bacterium]|jgi:carboxymethylenebutenolidase|nr:dienelactone hydrolase family protein [Acidimicrobiales bacterium]